MPPLNPFHLQSNSMGEDYCHPLAIDEDSEAQGDEPFHSKSCGCQERTRHGPRGCALSHQAEELIKTI